MTAAPVKKLSHKEATRIIWLVVYSDLITNLFLFAMVLFAMSRLSRAEAARVSGSMRLAFASAEEVKAAQERAEARRAAVRALLAMHPELKAAGVTLNFGRDDASLNLPAGNLFELHSATPRAGLWLLVDRVAPVLAMYPYPVRVEGHTDDLPPAPGAAFRSNWQLSYARARRVMTHLAQRWQVPVERLSAVGHGPGRPLVPNEGNVDRAKNRRITLVLRSPEDAP
jgi:chemotaxis protein MotB